MTLRLRLDHYGGSKPEADWPWLGWRMRNSQSNNTNLTGDDSLSTKCSESVLVALCTIGAGMGLESLSTSFLPEGTGRSAVHPASCVEGTSPPVPRSTVCTAAEPTPLLSVWGRFRTPTSCRATKACMTPVPESRYLLVRVLVPLDTVCGRGVAPLKAEGTSRARGGGGVLVDVFTYCLTGVLSFLVAVFLGGVLVPVEVSTGCAMYVAFSMVDTNVYVPHVLVSLATVSVSLFLRRIVGVLVPLSLLGGVIGSVLLSHTGDWDPPAPAAAALPLVNCSSVIVTWSTMLDLNLLRNIWYVSSSNPLLSPWWWLLLLRNVFESVTIVTGSFIVMLVCACVVLVLRLRGSLVLVPTVWVLVAMGDVQESTVPGRSVSVDLVLEK